MFTGIITACEPLKTLEDKNGNILATVGMPAEWTVEIGESITVDGVCSTVLTSTEDSFTTEWMPETLRLTNLGTKNENDLVNLERSLTLQDKLSGHMVQGHVDAIGTVVSVEDDGESNMVTIEHSGDKDGYIISKGSIAINGISLTVVNPTPSQFSVAIIPHTWEHTNMHTFTEGTVVNLEYDMMAKYLKKIVDTYHNG